jgi:hypothetical protein
MLEYIEIAVRSKKVEKLFWHQLIAPGYGLVDNRDGKIRKTEAFYAFKELMFANQFSYEEMGTCMLDGCEDFVDE